MNHELQYICVGRIKDAHMMKGEVFVRLSAKRADWLDKLDHIQLRNGPTGAVKFYKIFEKRPHKEGLILVLDGVTNRTDAEALKGQDVEIPENYLVSEAGDAIFLKEILGFEVVDATLGSLGAIESFSTNGAQDLLVVRVNGKEQWIPFVEAFVQKMDFEARQLRVDLPPGLFEN
jgi:16S rRNA processing protein RimM